MVIPMNNTSDSKTRTKPKRIVGDGKRIIIRTNSDSLLVIGSGNLLEIERNDGEIQIVGDGCQVSVNTGCGTIKYKGDGGYLKTGDVNFNNITYEGDGGRIVSAAGTTKNCHKKTKVCERKSTYENLNGKTFLVKNKTNCQFNIPSVKNIHITLPTVVITSTKSKRN